MKFDKAIVIIERDNILTEIEACTNELPNNTKTVSVETIKTPIAAGTVKYIKIPNPLTINFSNASLFPE